MPKLIYISLMRLPTEKAHGLQIMQNCEAFADAGCDVTLWVARRWNTREMRAIIDPFAYYGIRATFKVRRIPCIDIFPLFPPESAGARLSFYLLQLSYALASLLLLPFTRADIFYSRDEFILTLLSRVKAKASLAYEAHQFPASGRGAALQAHVVSRVGSVIALTPRLREDLIRQRGADSARVIIAHDGIRRARFADIPDQAAARQQVGWPQEAFIVGYLGRLHTIGMDKGVGTLVEALAANEGACLALVGGPDDMAESLRRKWLALGLRAECFLYAGHVPPDQVALFLSAFDICAMPHPPTAQFSRYTSPLKLFEYMAAGRAIVASDLPAWSDVVADGETAVLVPPADAPAWSEAISRLRLDREMRARLGGRAREMVLEHYTWDVRAERILAHIRAERSQTGGGR
ncbi:MAG: glycosyltransferase family 4 protein [Chloroflexota bacterium]|nr:glycosyltransferase family 4 protein [Chloroflexota bacterium]